MKSAAASVFVLRAIALSLLLHVVPAAAEHAAPVAATAPDAKRDQAPGRAAPESEYPLPRDDGAYVVMSVKSWALLENVLARSARLIHLQRVEIERLKRRSPGKECF